MSKGKLICGIALTMVIVIAVGASLMLNWYPSTTALVVAGSLAVIVIAFQLRRSVVRRRKAAKAVTMTTQQAVAVVIDRDLMIDTNPATNPGPTRRIDHFKYDPSAREPVLN